MPSPSLHTDKIMGERLISGMRIKFTATRDPVSQVWTVDILDHHGEFSRDFANSTDPMNVWGVIVEMLDAAERSSRAALKEMAEAAE